MRGGGQERRAGLEGGPGRISVDRVCLSQPERTRRRRARVTGAWEGQDRVSKPFQVSSKKTCAGAWLDSATVSGLLKNETTRSIWLRLNFRPGRAKTSTQG